MCPLQIWTWWQGSPVWSLNINGKKDNHVQWSLFLFFLQFWILRSPERPPKKQRQKSLFCGNNSSSVVITDCQLSKQQDFNKPKIKIRSLLLIYLIVPQLLPLDDDTIRPKKFQFPKGTPNQQPQSKILKPPPRDLCQLLYDRESFSFDVFQNLHWMRR